MAADNAMGPAYPYLTVDRQFTDAELAALLHDYLFLGPEQNHRLAFSIANDWVEDAPEECWRLICLAAVTELTIDQSAFFAAGPLEDLLGDHGDRFIDRLEAAARRETGMRTLVACVWRGRMSEAIWGRVLALREKLGIKPL